jgi:hypothetical protein
MTSPPLSLKEANRRFSISTCLTGGASDAWPLGLNLKKRGLHFPEEKEGQCC